MTSSPSYSFHKSSYHKSCFLSLFISHGHWTGACIQQGDMYSKDSGHKFPSNKKHACQLVGVGSKHQVTNDMHVFYVTREIYDHYLCCTCTTLTPLQCVCSYLGLVRGEGEVQARSTSVNLSSVVSTMYHNHSSVITRQVPVHHN